uniref:Uncharacterized protein n=1 Tax=Cacopsylla melanoneura TaxID=428564 RepID=A0A8D8PTW6_9HEMI
MHSHSVELKAIWEREPIHKMDNVATQARALYQVHQNPCTTGRLPRPQSKKDLPSCSTMRYCATSTSLWAERPSCSVSLLTGSFSRWEVLCLMRCSTELWQQGRMKLNYRMWNRPLSSLCSGFSTRTKYTSDLKL